MGHKKKETTKICADHTSLIQLKKDEFISISENQKKTKKKKK